jgi:hypothetical protein
MGRTQPTMAIIDNFDGMKQTLDWQTATEAPNSSKTIMPTGMLKVQVAGKMYTDAAGSLAPWAAINRACMDASKYAGIQFNVTGNVTNLFFRIGTPATYPVSEGGTCTDTISCYAHWQKDVTAGLKGGVTKVAFMGDLVAPFGKPAPFMKDSLVSIIFLTTDANTAHSFTVDNISFY